MEYSCQCGENCQLCSKCEEPKCCCYCVVYEDEEFYEKDDWED